MMQTISTLLILALAIGYAGCKIRQLWFSPADSCGECDGCALKKQICDKKTPEKFGHSK